jgi:hypothetical protein
VTLINREDVLALIQRSFSPALASALADAIAALPAQVATDAEREEYAERCERTADAREADGVIADAAFFRRTALLLRARCHT